MIETEVSHQIIGVKEVINRMKEVIGNLIETISNHIVLSNMIEITNKHNDIEMNLRKEIPESEDSQKTDQMKPEAIDPIGKMKLLEEISLTSFTLT